MQLHSLHKPIGNNYTLYEAVREIKGAPCTPCQCSKLRVHSAPGAHISAAGRTFFGRVRPMCAHIFIQFSLLHTRGVHRKIPGRTVLICVHPRGAQNKTLFSNTACAYFYCWVHRFKDLCTQCVHTFSNILIPLYKEEHMDKLPGARF